MRALTALTAALFFGLALAAEMGQIPEGFTPILNHAGLAGWHISMTSHHGDTKEWRIYDGVLTAAQDRPGNGGILLTDKRYRDFEI